MSKFLSGIGGTILKAGTILGAAGFIGTNIIYNGKLSTLVTRNCVSRLLRSRPKNQTAAFEL